MITFYFIYYIKVSIDYTKLFSTFFVEILKYLYLVNNGFKNSFNGFKWLKFKFFSNSQPSVMEMICCNCDQIDSIVLDLPLN